MPKTNDIQNLATLHIRIPQPLMNKAEIRAAAMGLKTADIVRYALAQGLMATEDHQGRGKDAA